MRVWSEDQPWMLGYKGIEEGKRVCVHICMREHGACTCEHGVCPSMCAHVSMVYV